MAQPTLIVAISVVILSHLFISGTKATTFTIVNNCNYVVWPGILSNAGVPTLPTTGFTLQRGETKTITAPPSWGGRFWGRTHCLEDSTGKFSCLTGDCGSGNLECSGNGAAPPATLAEFTLDGAGGFDFFDVSLVDGYNVPMLVVPEGGKGQNCSSTGCVVDLNGSCPSELRVTDTTDGRGGVACRSACDAFRQPQYCCSGAYATPDTCKPSSYSRVFKTACPRAYSYAYDDKTSTFTCANADYTITFCPSPNTSQKSSQEPTTQGENTATTTTTQGEDTGTTTTMPSSPLSNTTIVYDGLFDESGVSHPIAGAVGIIVAILWSWAWQLF
ncbi:Thaumatin-like protein 1 [Hibiscus syriacus]|uniref:Thaumatin-like protein 1 n=1 Tax=Hibiscus syriacus TaxID=106335 RepID=A0A6A2WTW8_HIBSY|nr:pathogenesis-related thaumatin-like protein 3.5 [Hibiscus syriacus]KAE8658925.1 Thaumatin-like protein 1 [Hibiscus syriacus]